jgi:hypothetical protein
MRVLIVIPHYFGGTDDSPNRSRMTAARPERLRALIATISSLHQALGTATYGLDHHGRVSTQMAPPHALDIIVCTTGATHLLSDCGAISPLFHRRETNVDPLLLGFECHKVLREARGDYDYYGYVEDDIVLTDPLFFAKRQLFDSQFGPGALLQPHRYEASPVAPVNKLYVDYRLNPRVTAGYQDIAEQAKLEMPFLSSTVRFERTPYPSAGCFFLNDQQLAAWTDSPHFLDGDVSYLSPGDSAVTLSVMKTFRIYKAVLDHAWFLEVLHASPRWIGSANQITRLVRHPHPS